MHIHSILASHGTYSRNIHKTTTKYAKSHKVACFEKGDKVAVSIPLKDPSSTNLRPLPCVVVGMLGRHRKQYCLQCKHGVISKCCPGSHLEPYTGELVKMPTKQGISAVIKESSAEQISKLTVRLQVPLQDRMYHSLLYLSG